MSVQKKLVICLVISAVFFVWLPLLGLIMPSRINDYMMNELGLQLVYKKATEGCKSNSSRVAALYQFVTTNVQTPPKSLLPKQIFPFEILIEGTGYCDQQSNLLISLAEKGEIKGNLIFLRGFDHVSHHSVCEIDFDRGYKMFDPLYKRTFQNLKNQLASIQDIQDSSIHYPTNMTGLPEFYFRLYEKRYPYTICKSNELPIHRFVLAKILGAWIFCFNESLLPIYIRLYTKTSDKYYTKHERIRAILSDKTTPCDTNSRLDPTLRK
jgi:hypothetical protein